MILIVIYRLLKAPLRKGGGETVQKGYEKTKKLHFVMPNPDPTTPSVLYVILTSMDKSGISKIK